MAPHDQTQAFVLVAIVILLGWRMYSRIRRSIGRQRLSPRRPWVTVVLFPLLLLLLGVGAFANPATTFALLCGVGIGIALGLYGLQLTKFEQAADGLFYTPNAHIGIALSVVFAGRLVYRLAQTFASGAAPVPPNQVVYGPLTLFIFGTLSGYYVTYAVGLIRWSRRVAKPPAVDLVQPPDAAA